MFNQGKTKFCTLLEKNRAVHEMIEIFNQQMPRQRRLPRPEYAFL